MMFSYFTFCYEPKTWMNVALKKVGKLTFIGELASDGVGLEKCSF